MANAGVYLKKGKERSLDRFHPWIFSGAIAKVEDNPVNGDIVSVFDYAGKCRATGIYSTGSIQVRILDFEEIKINDSFWQRRIANAWQLRKEIGLVDNPKTNIYRLVHAEGDLLPGVIVDVYHNVAVLQAHNHGIHVHRNAISKAIVDTSEGRVQGVYYKSDDTLPRDIHAESGWVAGKEPESTQPLENGFKFEVDWKSGQKTGFFIDQRENRHLLQQLSNGKKILNTFCYTGGFSVYAIGGGAQLVDSVDSSMPALELCESNVKMTGHSGEHNCIKTDALQFVKNLQKDYDIVVLDPPAFAKHLKARHRATQAYKRLNAVVMKQLKPGALLFTFSCSQVVDTQLFRNTLLAAAIDSGRSVRILHQLHQPVDHPVNIFHPESEYLKGFVLRID